MGFSGPLRSAPVRRFPALWLLGGALALIAPFSGAAAAEDPLPPVADAGPAPGDASDPFPLEQAPLPEPPEAGLAPPPPFPADPAGVPPPPFPDGPLGDGAQGRADEATESPAVISPPAILADLPGGEPSAPASASPDGTISVLVPPSSAPAGPAGGMIALPNPSPPAGVRPPPPLPAPPPPVAIPATTVAVAPPPSQAADLVARGLELPFPLVAGSPTAEVSPPRPLALLEALERSGDRTRRLWITQAYWKLAAAAARVRYAAEAEERLTLVAPGESPDDLVLLDLATATARGESAMAGVDLVAAQQEIVDLVRLPVTDPPPWPIDRPLTTAYQTHFETIFAGRPATGRVRAIHRQLPLEYAALAARAEAVRAAESRFASTEALHAKGKKPIGAVLTAHDAIVEQAEAFVRAVRAYNLDIAEYVMAVADLSVPDERFAIMLIGQPTPWRQPLAAAPPFAGNDRVVPVGGQSFAPAQGALSPDLFPAGTPAFQTPPAVGLPPQPGGGGLGSGPAPGRFGPPPNPPAGSQPPVVGAPFGG